MIKKKYNDTKNCFVKKIQKKIKHYKIISFDIFDTLLVRPYAEPNDLFAHLGLLNNIENFKNIRWNAFLESRKKYCINGVDEVTLDEIYEFVPNECKFMKEKEIELEIQVLQQNPEMKAVWDYALKLNKKIICVSDMYMPKEFLDNVLRKNGYIPDEIFVSSEYKKLKARKELYNIVIDKLKCSPKDILHIGDNLKSDVEQAKATGINAIHYTKIIDRYFNTTPRAKEFYEQNNNKITTSIFLGTSAIVLNSMNLLKERELQNNEYWQKMGVEYSGVLAYSFMFWLNTQLTSSNINQVLFVARDCYTLKKVFEIINPHLKTQYIYAPRLIALASTLSFGKKFELNEKEPVTGVNALIRYFNDNYPNTFKVNVTRVNNAKEAHDFLADNSSILKKMAEKELKKYKNYLNSLNIQKGEIAFVDMMTTFFTGQNLLVEALPECNIKGFYCWVARKFLSYYKKYYKYESVLPFAYPIPFVELLITSLEYPIVNIKDNKPIYEKFPTDLEIKRKKTYIEIEKGCLNFAKALKSAFGDFDLFFDYEVVSKWINNFKNTPTFQDKVMFKSLCHAWEIDHKDYKQIFPEWYSEGNIDKKIIKGGNMYLYKDIENGWYKKRKVLGLTVYKRDLIHYKNKPYCEHKYLKGLFKMIENKNEKYYYILGVKIFRKTKPVTYDMIKECIESSNLISSINNSNFNTINRLTYINQRLISAAFLHQKTFGPWKGTFRGKDVVLIGAGPTVKYFEPIKDAIYVGCNRAFRFDKIDFDFLFSTDKVGIEKWYDEFFNYRKDKCIKFIGDQNLGEEFQIPENKIPFENVYRFVTYAGIEECSRFNLDISTSPLHNAATITIQALQWILYTQPKRIYIVGVDCTVASKKYFSGVGKEFDNSSRGENVESLDNINIQIYGEISKFAKTFYPDTEIISINPIGLKGIFKDVYTEGYGEYINENIS